MREITGVVFSEIRAISADLVPGAKVSLRAAVLLLAGASVISAQGQAQRNRALSQNDAPATLESPDPPVQQNPSRSPDDSAATLPAHSQREGNSYEKERLSVNPITGQVTSPAERYVPLTNQERWKLYWKQNYFSVGAYFGPLFTALVLDQTTNSPSEWGGGIRGYGLRFASRLTGTVIGASIQAPAAAILHEDVRYIASPGHGFKRRAAHALIYSFLTYNSRGHSTLNVANLGAYYASTAISTAWLPDRYNVCKYALTNGTEQIALTVPVNLLQEFWPEITRKLLRRS